MERPGHHPGERGRALEVRRTGHFPGMLGGRVTDRATAPVRFLSPRQGSDVPQQASCLLSKLTFVLLLDQEKVCMGHREEDRASLSRTEPRPPSCRAHFGQGLPSCWGPQCWTLSISPRPHPLSSLCRLACRPAWAMGTPSAASARCTGMRV